MFRVSLSVPPGVMPSFDTELSELFKPAEKSAPDVLLKCIEAVEKRGSELVVNACCSINIPRMQLVVC